MEKIVIGASEDTQAEYGSRADQAFTLLILVDDEVTSVEGYNTLEAAINDAGDCQKEIL